MKTKKEKQQIIALGVFVGIIIAVVGFMNRSVFIPVLTETASTLTGSPLKKVSPVDYSKVFTRKDFVNLKDYADLPIRPGTLGSDEPFGIYVE